MQEKYLEIDSKLGDFYKNLHYLKYLNPINEKKLREAFFETGEEPKFEYLDLKLDYSKIDFELDKIDEVKSNLGFFLNSRVEYFQKICDLLLKRGTEDFMRSSIDLFGKPSEELVNLAKEILNSTPSSRKKVKKTLSALDLKSQIETYFLDEGLTDWRVILKESRITTVDHKRKAVLVCKSRSFDQDTISRLILHEIEVHVLRAENGHNQPLKYSFSQNVSNSLMIEEGLAIYVQVENNLMPKGSWRSICANVIAIDLMVKGESFTNIFNTLREYGFNKIFAWRKCLRIFRGGGLTKDYIYLEGYYRIKNFVELGGKIENLYYGRISIEDIEWVIDLKNKNILNDIKYLPIFLQK